MAHGTTQYVAHGRAHVPYTNLPDHKLEAGPARQIVSRCSPPRCQSYHLQGHASTVRCLDLNSDQHVSIPIPSSCLPPCVAAGQYSDPGSAYQQTTLSSRLPSKAEATELTSQQGVFAVVHPACLHLLETLQWLRSHATLPWCWGSKFVGSSAVVI